MNQQKQATRLNLEAIRATERGGAESNGTTSSDGACPLPYCVYPKASDVA